MELQWDNNNGNNNNNKIGYDGQKDLCYRNWTVYTVLVQYQKQNSSKGNYEDSGGPIGPGQ